MTISLYDAAVGSYLQLVPATEAILAKGEEFAAAQGLDLHDLVEQRLHPDMLPLRYQIVSVAHHSLGCIEGIQAGEFRPPKYDPTLDFAAMRDLLAQTRQKLAALEVDAVNALADRSLEFVLGEMRLPFTAPNFVLSFSLPNFYFHVTTAYDILRHTGVPLGKRDYTGRLRISR